MEYIFAPMIKSVFIPNTYECVIKESILMVQKMEYIIARMIKSVFMSRKEGNVLFNDALNVFFYVQCIIMWY